MFWWEQGWANNRPQHNPATACYVNKVLLEYSTTCSFTCCLWLHLLELSGFKETVAHKIWNVYPLTLYRKSLAEAGLERESVGELPTLEVREGGEVKWEELDWVFKKWNFYYCISHYPSLWPWIVYFRTGSVSKIVQVLVIIKLYTLLAFPKHMNNLIINDYFKTHCY